MALIPSPLDDRNKASRKIVEENHRTALKVEIDVQLRSQKIELGITAASFRTPCRIVISGPTLRHVFMRQKMSKYGPKK